MIKQLKHGIQPRARTNNANNLIVTLNVIRFAKRAAALSVSNFLRLPSARRKTPIFVEHARFRKCYRGRAGRAKRRGRLREHTTHPNISSHNSLSPKGLGAKLRDRISFLGSWKQLGPRFIVVESSIKVPSKFCLPRHNIVVPFYLYLAFPSSLPFFSRDAEKNRPRDSTTVNQSRLLALFLLLLPVGTYFFTLPSSIFAEVSSSLHANSTPPPSPSTAFYPSPSRAPLPDPFFPFIYTLRR